MTQRHKRSPQIRVFSLCAAALALLVSMAGCGRSASVELMDRAAREALAARKFVDAEVAAEKAALLDPSYVGVRFQVRGAAAYGRSLVSEAAAEMPGAAPALFDVARKQTELAREAWRSALQWEPHSEQIRRNLERAVRRIELLMEKKRFADEARRNAPKRPRPVPKDEGSASGTPEAKGSTDAPIEIAVEDLPPEGARRVLERALEKQREKKDTRRVRRDVPMPAVEKDW